MPTKTEVETITRKRMVSREDIAEYQQRGWKFVENKGKMSAIMEKTEKVQAKVVPSKPEVKDKGVKSNED